MRQQRWQGVAVIFAGAALIASIGVQPAAASPRPTPPAIASLQGLDDFDCRNATAQPPAPLVSAIQRERQRFEAMGAHTRALSEWYGQQFVQAGVWSDADARAFDSNLANGPASADFRDWAVQLREQMLASFSELDTHQRASDYPAACRVLMRMLTEATVAPARIQQQWVIIEQAYVAEAARLGVTLEP